MMKYCRDRRHFIFCIIIVLSIILQPLSCTPFNNNKRSRHHRDSTPTTDLPYTTHITLLETNPCLVHYCSKGRECIVEAGVAVCVCQKQCVTTTHHRKLVCGSDGHIYPNHCELHRAACMSAIPITIERGVHCIKHGKGWAPSLQHSNLNFNQDSVGTAINRTDNNEHEVDYNANYLLETNDNNVDADKNFNELTTISIDSDNKLVEQRNDRITNGIIVDDDDDDKNACSMQEYEIMKDNLLLYNHARLMSQDNHSKDYLVSIMFSHYDKNNNGNLEETELNEVDLDLGRSITFR